MMNGEIWWIDFQEPRGVRHSKLSTVLLDEVYEEIFWSLKKYPFLNLFFQVAFGKVWIDI